MNLTARHQERKPRSRDIALPDRWSLTYLATDDWLLPTVFS
jgi:hypothetical protein